MKKAKRTKPEVPIYGAAKSAPLNIDTLIAVGRRSSRPVVVQLAERIALMQNKLDTEEPTSEEARQLAEKCRSALSEMFIYLYSTPLTEDAICEAILRGVEAGAVSEAYAVANNLPPLILNRVAFSDDGKRGAAKRYGSVKEKKRNIKRADALRVANEQRKGGVSEESIAKRLSGKLGVKLDTAKKILRKAGT